MVDSWDESSSRASCGSSSKKWVCKACTYENWPRASRCAICCHPKNYNPFMDTKKQQDIYEVCLFVGIHLTMSCHNRSHPWSRQTRETRSFITPRTSGPVRHVRTLIGLKLWSALSVREGGPLLQLQRKEPESRLVSKTGIWHRRMTSYTIGRAMRDLTASFLPQTLGRLPLLHSWHVNRSQPTTILVTPLTLPVIPSITTGTIYNNRASKPLVRPKSYPSPGQTNRCWWTWRPLQPVKWVLQQLPPCPHLLFHPTQPSGHVKSVPSRTGHGLSSAVCVIQTNLVLLWTWLVLLWTRQDN